MARPISSASQTLQDYGKVGSGTGAEKSNWAIWTTTLTSANFVAVTGAVSTLFSAVLDITLGGQAGTRILAADTREAVNITNPQAQRENKWLVRYHDSAGTKFSVEIPTADLSLLTEGDEFLKLDDGGPIAAFVTAFEAVAKSPDDPTLSVTVDSIQYVSRRS